MHWLKNVNEIAICMDSSEMLSVHILLKASTKISQIFDASGKTAAFDKITPTHYWLWV